MNYNFPSIPKTDPFCDKCLASFNQSAQKIIQINAILNQITEDINSRKSLCNECCKTGRSQTCTNIRSVNSKSEDTVKKIKLNLVELYREIKKYYLPNVPTTNL